MAGRSPPSEKEAARLWSWLVERHAQIRQQGDRWPNKADLRVEIKGLFPGLHSQSAQMILDDFLEAIASAESLRKNGELFKYPHRKLTYRQVLFRTRSPRFRSTDSRACPAARPEVSMPYSQACDAARSADGGPTRLWRGGDRLRGHGRDPPHRPGIDLDASIVIAATDGDKAIVISGRLTIKATVQHPEQAARRDRLEAGQETKRSRRHKSAPAGQVSPADARQEVKVRDLCHKATRKGSRAAPERIRHTSANRSTTLAARRVRNTAAQTVSSACNRKIINLLNYKLAACIEVEEVYSSQTVPPYAESVSKHGRTYCCRCGYERPAMSVGCTQRPHHRHRGRHATRVVAYPTQSNSDILPSILALSR